ncbi:hypothetical protein CLU79DRAFT_805358 [Phycomyces nitens]|nr:hypothetical protein CLU79DRAFT_805358 [Phycomyces nitens]
MDSRQGKLGSVNTFVGKHPLGDRARKIDQGILVVRFELPFNIWCTGCDQHIGKGVRYNAEKKKIGNYYSTAILQFRMKCHLCSGWIEIHTDPKAQNAKYLVVSGARQKMEEWEAEDSEAIKLEDPEIKEKMESDPMYRLEHGIKDKKVWDDAVPVLTQIQRLNDSHWEDPYSQSQQLRRKFRQEKKLEKAVEDETNRLRDKHSLHIPLVAIDPQDDIKAKLVDYSGPAKELVEQRKLQKTASPLFPVKSDKPNLTQFSQRVKIQTRLKTDPFLNTRGFKRPSPSTTNTSPKKTPKGLVSYASEDEESE